MTATATIPQVKDYLVAYLLKHTDGITPLNDPRNDRLLVAIDCLSDIYEGLAALVEEQVKKEST